MEFKLYNKQPESIKILKNIKLFKKRIKILTIEPFLLLSWWVLSVQLVRKVFLSALLD